MCVTWNAGSWMQSGLPQRRPPQRPHAAAAWSCNCCNPVAFWPGTCPIGPSPACHRRIETKELKLRPATDVHDYQVGGGGLLVRTMCLSCHVIRWWWADGTHMPCALLVADCFAPLCIQP